MKRIQIFFLNSILLVISTLLLKGLSSLFDIYIANKIGTEAIGTYSLLISIYMLTITLASSGINLACVRITSEELNLNNSFGAKKSVKYCILISLIFGIIVSIILLLFKNLIISSFLKNRIDSSALISMAFALPFISMTSAISGYFTALRQVYKNIICQVFEQFSKIVFTTFLLNYFLPKGITYTCFALILGDAISEIIAFFSSYIFLFLDSKKTKIVRKKNEIYVKRILNIAIPISITTNIKSTLSTFKQFIIPSELVKSGLSYDIALSKYGIISGMVIPIILFPSLIISAFSGLLIPELSRFSVNSNSKKIRQIASYSLVITSIFSILLTILIMIFAKNLNNIFYPNYNITKYLIFISPLILFIYTDIVIDNILKGLNAQVSVMIINILDVFFTVSFIYVFVPILGTKGYILSLYISEFLNFFLSGYKLIRIL